MELFQFYTRQHKFGSQCHDRDADRGSESGCEAVAGGRLREKGRQHQESECCSLPANLGLGGRVEGFKLLLGLGVPVIALPRVMYRP